jgi:hypothetical protein
MSFDGLFDLSSSNVTFRISLFINSSGRSNCREGVTEIVNVQNDALSIVQIITVTSKAQVKNINCLPINQASYSSGV